MGCIVSAQADAPGGLPRRVSTKRNVVSPASQSQSGDKSSVPNDKLTEEYEKAEAVTTKLADLLTHRASKARKICTSRH